MVSRRLGPLLLALALLTACGSTSSEDTPAAGSDGGGTNSSSGDKDAKPSVEIVDFGVGQSDGNAQGVVIVTTDDKAAIGESVTVTANFLDAGGQIIATEEQVESFNWVGQQLVLPVSHYLDKPTVQVARIEPSASLSDYGMTKPDEAPLPVLKATEIKKGEYGGYTASFAFTNETDEDLKSLRVGVVCQNAAKKIIGGASTYPELAPAGKTIRIDADVTASKQPATCAAYVNYDVM